MAKVTVASDWLAGCAGCHMSLLDMDETIVDLLQVAQLTSTPITDLKHPPKEGVDVGILEGAVNNSATENVARMMRSRCKVLIAMGDCAVFGGVPAMRNFFNIEDALKRAYVETESTDDEGKIPTDPELCRPTKVRALHEVVPVDIWLPGCPPSADQIFYVLSELAQGRMPEVKDDKLQWH